MRDENAPGEKKTNYAENILAAKFGSPVAGDELLIISSLGAEGRHALVQLEEKCGPLVGRVAGMFRPCRMEQAIDGLGKLYLFSLPTDIVPRARLRTAQGYLAPGFGFVTQRTDAEGFEWVGEEPSEKLRRGVVLDSYPPPQLSSEWAYALIEKPELDPLPNPQAPSPSQTATPVTTGPRSISAVAPSPNTGLMCERPKAYALRVVGEQGRQSMARLQKRFGRVPAQLKIGGDTQVLVFPLIGSAAGLLAGNRGEIAPGVSLEPESVFIPNSNLAGVATKWLSGAISARKK